MKIVKPSTVPAKPATSALFTGEVSRQPILTPEMSQNFNLGIVNFPAGVRNKMHTHGSDQVLFVTAGTGIIATETEEKEITVGDVVHIKADEQHWHGATAHSDFSHIALWRRAARRHRSNRRRAGDGQGPRRRNGRTRASVLPARHVHTRPGHVLFPPRHPFCVYRVGQLPAHAGSLLREGGGQGVAVPEEILGSYCNSEGQGLREPDAVRIESAPYVSKASPGALVNYVERKGCV